MADLTDSQSASSVKLVGANASGLENNFAQVGTTGRLLVDAILQSEQLDTFGRFRISSPTSLFDCTFETDARPLLFSTSTASGATVTHNSTTKSVVLAASTTLNSRAIFQSKQYIKYHPGKSQQILMTGNFNGGVAGIRKRLGHHDDNNGYYFEMDGTTAAVVIRSSISGSIVNNTVTQANWNLDKLDGTGTSGLTVDFSKQLIFVIEYQWLGSGLVRYGFFINDKIYYCHVFYHSNVSTNPYSQTGYLPIRASCTNTTGVNSSNMHITCVTVVSEGGFAPYGELRSVNNGILSRAFTSAGTTIPVISLRKQSEFVTFSIEVINIEAFANSTDDFLLSVVIDGTLTLPTWTNVSGICQQDVTAIAITGGTTVYSTYIRGTSSGASIALKEFFQQAQNVVLGSDLQGNSQLITIVATNLTSNANISGVINYKEIL